MQDLLKSLLEMDLDDRPNRLVLADALLDAGREEEADLLRDRCAEVFAHGGRVREVYQTIRDVPFVRGYLTTVLLEATFRSGGGYLAIRTPSPFDLRMAFRKSDLVHCCKECLTFLERSRELPGFAEKVGVISLENSPYWGGWFWHARYGPPDQSPYTSTTTLSDLAASFGGMGSLRKVHGVVRFSRIDRAAGRDFDSP